MRREEKKNIQKRSKKLINTVNENNDYCNK